jgi:hypothetical protein
MHTMELARRRSVEDEVATPLVHQIGAARRLTWLAAAAAVVAAAPSLVAPGLLRGEPVMDGNLRGTALVVLLVVPLLLRCAQRAGTSSRAVVGWLGTLAYLLYQGVMFAFATPMNRLFLAYVALLGTAGWALAVLARRVDVAEVTRRLGPGFPARPLAGVIGTVAVLNVLAWLAQAAPIAWTGEQPVAVVDSGLPTGVTWVQDLAFWLPAALALAVLTWRGAATAPWLAGFGWLWTLEAVSVASDQWWGTRADSSHPALASYPAAVGAFLAAAAMAAVTAWALRRRDPRATPWPPGARSRITVVVLAGLTSVSALVGSVQLLFGVFTPPVSDLEPLGLETWRLPGLWLLASVAVPCAAAAVLAWRRDRRAGTVSIAAGALLLVELAVQVPFVGLDPLQPTMALVALALVGLGWRLRALRT